MSERLSDERLGEQGEPVAAQCQECGCELGAGYLCDDCDELEVVRDE